MMEVAEHVPQQYEGQLLENVESRALFVLVLSVLGFLGACFVLFFPLIGCNLACNSLDTRLR